MWTQKTRTCKVLQRQLEDMGTSQKCPLHPAGLLSDLCIFLTFNKSEKSKVLSWDPVTVRPEPGPVEKHGFRDMFEYIIECVQ